MSAPAGKTIWSSRTAFLMASIGGAVGLGNLWRFPYVAGENGGGGFVLVYIGFVLLLGIPLMAAELMLGRAGHSSPVRTMATLVRDQNASGVWRLIGWLSVLMPLFALSYYAVVAAWTLDYLWLAIGNAFSGLDAEASQDTFANHTSLPLRQALLHGVFMGMTVWVVANGVNNGIERATKVLLPLLFVVIVALVGYGIFAADFPAAVRFLFRPDFSRLTADAVLIALGQAFFSLSVATGMLITYGAYVPREFSLRRSSFIIAGGDTAVALLAGLAIFPIVFASGLSPGEGPGLIFVTLPIAFGSMPGGQVIGVLFFLLLFFAAYSTSIAMLEPITSWLSERAGGRRPFYALLAGCITWLVGLLSVFSFNLLSDFHPLGALGVDKTVFDLLDYAVANLMLPFNALLIALFSGWVLRRTVPVDQFDGDGSAWFAFWRFSVRYIAPVAIGLIALDLLRG